jgi:hypothetical protein
VSRPAPSGSDSATSGLLVAPGADLQRAAADVQAQQPPALQPNHRAHREEGQPRLVLARQHRSSTPARSRTALQDLGGVGGVADGGGREGHQVLDALLVGGLRGPRHGLDQHVGAVRAEEPSGLQQLGEVQRRLVRPHRGRGARPGGRRRPAGARCCCPTSSTPSLIPAA